MKLARYEAAITSCEKAIQIEPNSPDAWYNQACCYALCGDSSKAIQSLQQALTLDTEEGLRELAKTDPDLEGMREHPLFQNLLS